MRHRTKDYARIMNSRAWRRLRREYLALHPVCEDCEASGITTVATEVHHVIPVESAAGRPDDMQALALDASNLRALCHACHVEAHRVLRSNDVQTVKDRSASEVEAFADAYLSIDGRP